MVESRPVPPFANNWAYLKTELGWLDRLLMLAVARHQQDAKRAAKVPSSAGNQATSHWWKGLISLDSAGYDDCCPPPSTRKSVQGSTAQGYQGQIRQRIRASQRQGVTLALPELSQRLNLAPFEQKVILLTLAPEINARFGHLYRYLQSKLGRPQDVGLPTVDLCLKLLCHNDEEWKQGRSLLMSPDSLVAQGILSWARGAGAIEPGDSPGLNRQLKLDDAVVSYLLADAPNLDMLPQLTEATPASWLPRPPGTATVNPPGGHPVKVTRAVPWQRLVLPTSLRETLTTLTLAAQQSRVGYSILLRGAPGTGKQTVAIAVAQRLERDLVTVDLAAVSPAAVVDLLGQLACPESVVLLKSAHVWFGRNSPVEPFHLHHWLHQRRCQSGLTFLSLHDHKPLSSRWHASIDAGFTLPMPTPEDRRQLLRQAMPADVKRDSRWGWIQLARQLPLSGGELERVLGTAVSLIPETTHKVLQWHHLCQAVAFHHPHLRLRP